MAATEILMPSLAEGMEDATIIAWFKETGDEIAVGDELIEVETDKATMVYEAETAGVLVEIVAELGSLVEVGDPIARVEVEGEVDGGAPAGAADDAPGDAPAAEEASADGAAAPASAAEAAASKPDRERTAAPVSAAKAIAEPVADVPMGDRLRVSPLARRIARDWDIDLRNVSGTGPNGRIIRADIDRVITSDQATTSAGTDRGAAAAGAPARVSQTVDGDVKGQVEIVELSKTQETIARRMANAKSTAPHFYLEARIDVSAAVEARATVKREAGPDDVVPSLNDLVVKACALALRKHPLANGAYRDGRFELYSRVNVGIAVAQSDGLLVPTVFDADAKGLEQIATESRELARKVREGSITPPDLAGGTFTVSNLGMFGVDSFQAVINPPQAAILAVGQVVEEPVLRDGELASRSTMTVNLSCDHRILYGAQAAEFLATIRRYLEQPVRLAL